MEEIWEMYGLTEETRSYWALTGSGVAGVWLRRRERKEGMTNGVILAHLWRQYYDVILSVAQKQPLCVSFRVFLPYYGIWESKSVLLFDVMLSRVMMCFAEIT